MNTPHRDCIKGEYIEPENRILYKNIEIHKLSGYYPLRPKLVQGPSSGPDQSDMTNQLISIEHAKSNA